MRCFYCNHKACKRALCKTHSVGTIEVCGNHLHTVEPTIGGNLGKKKK